MSRSARKKCKKGDNPSQITQTAKRSGDPAESGRAGRGLFTFYCGGERIN